MNVAPSVYDSTDALLANAVARAARTLEELARENGLDCVTEARDLRPAMAVAMREVAAAATGAPEVRMEYRAAAVCWPKLGPVDIALLPNGSKAIWVEVKCGAGVNGLGSCVWDIVKCAWGLARGDAAAAYLVGGTTADDWARSIRGTEFFTTSEWSTWDLRAPFSDWWRHWEKDGYAAANRLPERFATHPISASRFSAGVSTWALRLAGVSVPKAVAWVEWPPLLGISAE